jgi:large subunit ribosomal protein L21
MNTTDEKNNYAIIQDGDKQYRVIPGGIIQVEKKPGEPGTPIQFSEVLLWAQGTDVKIGNPLVKGVRVTGSVVDQGKHHKITVIKFRRREGYHKKQGHRQKYTRVKIEQISQG